MGECQCRGGLPTHLAGGVHGFRESRSSARKGKGCSGGSTNTLSPVCRSTTVREPSGSCSWQKIGVRQSNPPFGKRATWCVTLILTCVAVSCNCDTLACSWQEPTTNSITSGAIRDASSTSAPQRQLPPLTARNITTARASNRTAPAIIAVAFRIVQTLSASSRPRQDGGRARG